jgi:hypothetical protein
MELSEFTLRIILLFIPGIISFIVIDKLTFHRESKLHQILISSLILGFVCYSFYYLPIQILKAFKMTNLECTFFNGLTNKSAQIDFGEIGFVALLSIPIGFLFAWMINYKVLFRTAHFLKITKKFGDIDVWSYIMNSKNAEWVVVRDIESDLMYEGWIEAFSDSTENDELLLSDVIVFKNSTGEELYKIPGLYLPKKRENLVIEFPSLKFSEYIKRPENKEKKNE